MEKPQNPWSPSQEALELSFERQTFSDLRNAIKAFATENDISYRIEKKPESMVLLPVTDNLAPLMKYVRETVGTLNEMLEFHKKNFFVEVEEYNNGLQIHVLKRP